MRPPVLGAVKRHDHTIPFVLILVHAQPVEPAIETEAGRSWLSIGLALGVVLGVVLALLVAGRLARQAAESQAIDEAPATDLDAPV